MLTMSLVIIVNLNETKTMRNPFRRRSHEKRGIPDTSIIPVSSSSAPPLVHTSTNMAVPPAYPFNNQNNPLPPIACPYSPLPDEGVSTGAVWEFNTGENKNMKGNQRGGNVNVGNTVAGSSAGNSFPQNGLFVFNTGKNYNEGDVQENGNVEFGNSIQKF